ncbi:DUF6114 domain-containing protein [Micromonospora sp. NPDC047707]|uniref:DUF6114 domain-containing protein n=1 Tax=Micromonospora sp. NPDC047707 TaxID=3154498 RepID=UPI003451571C
MRRAEPRRNARPNALRAGWGSFRRWRWTRPFWGGLLTALAGLAIFGTTQMSLSGLAFQLGPTGFLSWLIPTILVTAGLLMWFSPQHRTFYAVVAAVTALFALVGVNLGGFLIGTVTGLLGAALAAGWVPGRPATPGRDTADDGSTKKEGTAEPDDSADDRPQPTTPSATTSEQPATDISDEAPSASRQPWSTN